MTEVNELVRFQRELKEEEQLIVSMLEKIDVQLHALQVEQLQLLNEKNSRKEASSTNKETKTNETSATDTNVKKELDLVVPHVWQASEDEEDDDESN